MSLADGGEAIAALAVPRNQSAPVGPVASDPTAWRLLSPLDQATLAELRGARALAREIAWAQHADTRGDFPQVTAAGPRAPATASSPTSAFCANSIWTSCSPSAP
nr:hypothetical protein Ade03nite_56800 [Actinoplanes derwentensis]